jgi:hypothetical protein
MCGCPGNSIARLLRLAHRRPWLPAPGIRSSLGRGEAVPRGGGGGGRAGAHPYTPRRFTPRPRVAPPTWMSPRKYRYTTHGGGEGGVPPPPLRHHFRHRLLTVVSLTGPPHPRRMAGPIAVFQGWIHPSAAAEPRPAAITPARARSTRRCNVICNVLIIERQHIANAKRSSTHLLGNAKHYAAFLRRSASAEGSPQR